jgi:hypothetical protein
MRDKLILVLSLAGAILLFIGGTITAQERSTTVIAAQVAPTYAFGMIGLGTSQTARLNVVNLARTAPPVAVSVAQIPCKVELDIYDGQGKLLKQKTNANLGFGQADFLDLTRPEIVDTSTHVDVGGLVKVGSTQSYFCNVSATLEVFDSVTGATAAILAGSPSSTPAFVFTPAPLTSTQP